MSEAALSTFFIPINARYIPTDERVYVIAIERTREAEVRFHVLRNHMYGVYAAKHLRFFPEELALSTHTAP